MWRLESESAGATEDDEAGDVEVASSVQRRPRGLFAAFTSVPAPLLILDPFGLVAFASEAAESWLGGGALLGQLWSELLPFAHTDGRVAVYRAVAAALRGRPIDEPIEAILTMEGGRRVAEFRARPFELAGRRYATLGMEDLTALRAAESERNNLEHELRHAQRVEVVGSLVGGISHDFNNLLAVMRSCTELALESLAPDHPSRGELLELEEATCRAGDLARQLLAFSRKEASRPTELDLNEVVLGLQKMLRRIVGEDIELSLDLAHAPGVVRADLRALEQVVLNLVVNARDAMPRGGTLLIQTAHVETLETGDLTRWVELDVVDTGSGMDEDTLARIFDPFFTTKAPGRGTGLGLATVSEIVNGSGGRITVESVVGVGTRFRVLLPELTQRPARRGSVRIKAVRSGSETILLVEDEPRVRAIAKRILVRDGYRVIEAADGDEALEALRRHAVDMVVSDIIMPGMNGVELAERMQVAHPGIPILFVSGYAADRLDQRVDAPVLHKPFSSADLRRHVRDVLDRDVANIDPCVD